MEAKTLIIGVVAIVLVAGLGTFVLVSSDDGGTVDSDTSGSSASEVNAPQVSFSIEETNDGEVVATHASGGKVDGSNIHIRADGIGSNESKDYHSNNIGQDWESVAGESDLVAGSSVTVSVGGDYHVQVVYESGEGEAVLAQSTA